MWRLTAERELMSMLSTSLADQVTSQGGGGEEGEKRRQGERGRRRAGRGAGGRGGNPEKIIKPGGEG